MQKLKWAQVLNCKNLENENGRSYTSSNGALGTVTKYFEIWIENLDLDLTIEALQKPCLLGTARMIRKVLDVKWKKKSTIPKTTGWCPLSWHFLPGNNIRPESQEKIIMIIIIIIIIVIIIIIIIIIIMNNNNTHNNKKNKNNNIK